MLSASNKSKTGDGKVVSNSQLIDFELDKPAASRISTNTVLFPSPVLNATFLVPTIDSHLPSAVPSVMSPETLISTTPEVASS